MKESQIQAKLLQYLISLKEVYSFKVIRANKSGIPDVIACIKGKFFAFECKTQKGIVSPLQQLNIKKIREAYGTVFIVTDQNFDSIKLLINNL